jgi:hypothetical protein
MSSWWSGGHSDSMVSPALIRYYAIAVIFGRILICSSRIQIALKKPSFRLTAQNKILMMKTERQMTVKMKMTYQKIGTTFVLMDWASFLVCAAHTMIGFRATVYYELMILMKCCFVILPR